MFMFGACWVQLHTCCGSRRCGSSCIGKTTVSGGPGEALATSASALMREGSTAAAASLNGDYVDMFRNRDGHEQKHITQELHLVPKYAPRT
eukprot:g8653.t1